MDKDTVYTALDIGTSKVCTLVTAHRHDGSVDTVGVGIVPSQGMRKGVVVNVEEAKEAIRASLDEAARSAGTPTSSVYVSVTGSHLELFTRWGSLRTLDFNAPLSYDDIDMAVEAAYPRDLPPEKQVLHLVPQSYSVDGLGGVRNPIGMHASRMDVETLCIIAATTPLQHLASTVESAKVRVQGMVMAGLASGEAVLTTDEKEAGVVLVEIGSGATTVAVFQRGTLSNAAVLPVGGYQFTTDLAVALNAPFDVAEEAKLRYGSAQHESIGDERVELRAFGDRRTVKVERREFCRYLHDRAEEVLRLSYMKVREFGFSGILPAGVVLTGGTANLPDIGTVARSIFNTPVRIGVPTGLDNLPEGLRDPAYAASAGTVLWNIKNRAEREHRQASVRSNGAARAPSSANGGRKGWLRRRVSRVAA
jgi:cell division protein FtsA